MENNFDITKMYIDNKKKIGISNIFSIFINREKNKNEDIGRIRKENIKPKKNMKIQERSRAYEEYIKKKKIKQKDVRTKFFIFVFLGILLISMPMYIIFKSAESDELFTKVNRLKGQIEEQRKENEQLALNLQNQASLVKIEPTKIIKVQTNEKDYIETESVSIIRDKEESVIDKIFKFVMNLF